MKYLNMAKYRFFDMKFSLAVYYVVIISLNVFWVAVRQSINNPQIFIATAIFLFVAGLNSFKPQLKFLSQNGFTRQNIHLGFAAFLPMTIFLAIIDYTLYTVTLFADYSLSHAAIASKSFNPFGFYGSFGIAQSVCITVIASALSYAAAMSIGYMISALYYRLNKLGKVLISISVPAVLIIISSTIYSKTGYEGTLFLFARSAIFGSPDNIQYLTHFIIIMVLLIILCLSASQLLIRKANIKE